MIGIWRGVRLIANEEASTVTRATHHTMQIPDGKLFCLFALALLSLQAGGKTPEKKTIAVLDFANAALQSNISGSTPDTNGPDVGKGVAEMVVSKLVRDGNVIVVERSAIDKVLAEQNLSNSDRADAATAAKIGKLLGADAIILGTVTRYDYDEKLKGHTGGGRGSRANPSPKAKYDVSAKIQISTRVVSPSTAEVLAVSQGVGETDRKNVVMDVRDTSGRVMQAIGLNSPVMNESIDQAITQLAAQLEVQFDKLPPHLSVIEGVVADAGESGRLVLNVGGRDGVKVGDRLQVLRPGKEVRDPSTGKLLLRNDAVLGEAVVTAVNDISSIAQYQGAEPAKIGDVVKGMPKQP